MSGFFRDDFANFAEELASDMLEENYSNSFEGYGEDIEPEPRGEEEVSGEGDVHPKEREVISGDSPNSLETIKAELLQGLNEPQREAVMATEGPVLVLAGAGSGKTTVLTKRIAWILRSGLAKSYQILGVTFTNKAARELSDRLRRLCNISNFANVGTFHSVCSRWLRKEAEYLGISPNFTIFDSSAQQTLMRSVLKELGLDAKKFSPKQVLSRVSKLKNDGRLPVGLSLSKDSIEQHMYDIYHLYNRKLQENNALDFDDILSYTVHLFREYPDVLRMYTERIKYILIDEYQDVNAVQYELLRLLSGEKRNVCAVGDDDQSIYKFRGADLSIILRFAKDFSDAKTIKLEQNYRSTQAILDLANEVISKNMGRTGKKLWSQYDGEKPAVFGALTALDEAQFVADTIVKLRNVEGYRNSDFAVLYRANAMSRIFEEIFIKRGITHKIVGGQRFYERAEIKDLLAYFSLFTNLNDSVSLHRILENLPGVGAVTLQKLTEWGVQHGENLFNSLSHGESLGLRKVVIERFLELQRWIEGMIEKARERTSLSELLEEIISFSDFQGQLRARYSNDTDYSSRWENVDELISTVANFDKNYQGSISPLEAFMAEVSLYSDQDDYDSEPNSVTLMTVHTSKGLEFPVVFLVGLEENTLPSYLSLQDNEVEEERRLCYVGMTRAKQRLFLSFAVKRDKATYRDDEFEVSRFLKDASIEHLNCLNMVARQYLKPDGAGAELHSQANTFRQYGAQGYGQGRYGWDNGRRYGQQERRKRKRETKRVYDTLKDLEESVILKSSSSETWVSTWGTTLGDHLQNMVDDVDGCLVDTLKPQVPTKPLKSSNRNRARNSDPYEEIKSKFSRGTLVEHKMFGLGKVSSIECGYVMVQFLGGSERLLSPSALSVVEDDTDIPEIKPRTLRAVRVGDWVEFPVFGRGIVQEDKGSRFIVVFAGFKRSLDRSVVQNVWEKQQI